MKKSGPGSRAVMNAAAGEEIAGLSTTPRIPEIGVCKLAARKRSDGKYAWVHFQHRPDGTRKVLARGEVDTKTRLVDVLEAANSALKSIYGVVLQAAEFDTCTRDGKKDSGIVH
jgi:hypothetical protein